MDGEQCCGAAPYVLHCAAECKKPLSSAMHLHSRKFAARRQREQETTARNPRELPRWLAARPREHEVCTKDDRVRDREIARRPRRFVRETMLHRVVIPTVPVKGKAGSSRPQNDASYPFYLKSILNSSLSPEELLKVLYELSDWQ